MKWRRLTLGFFVHNFYFLADSGSIKLIAHFNFIYVNWLFIPKQKYFICNSLSSLSGNQIS